MQWQAFDKPVSRISAYRSSRPEVFCKKGVLRNLVKFTGKRLCESHFFNKVAGLMPATLLKKETLAQVFSCEFCKISKSTFSYRTPLVTASEHNTVYLEFHDIYQLKLIGSVTNCSKSFPKSTFQFWKKWGKIFVCLIV